MRLRFLVVLAAVVACGGTSGGSGSIEPDAGPTPAEDAGLPDSGTVVDAGTPAPDGGSTTPDAGAPAPDAGAPAPDAGAPAPDAGTIADECSGLMPAAIPQPVTVQISSNNPACNTGVSDDGQGNFALNYSDIVGDEFVEHVDFYSGTNGALLHHGFGGDAVRQISIFSQSSGFAVFSAQGDGIVGTNLNGYSHEGQNTSTRQITGFDNPGFARAGSDPSGGLAVVHTLSSTGDGKNFVTSYQRYDSQGNPAGAQVPLPENGGYVRAVGVTLSGDVLIVNEAFSDFFNEDQEARTAIWVTRDGQPITGWFDFGNQATGFQFLLDGSLLELDSGSTFGESGIATAVVHDRATAASPLPAWLALRPGGTVPMAVRQGKAYALFHTSQCAQLEVVTPAGKSCGCANLPESSAQATVGRDGSVILPSGTGDGKTCHFQLYPQLLH